jgi:competence protein ComEA
MKIAGIFRVLPLLWPAFAFAGPVNINTADALTLANELKGIGPARAAAIVAYRQQHGQFRSVDELALIKGIGKSVIDRNRADLRLSSAPAAPARASAPAARPAAR